MTRSPSRGRGELPTGFIALIRPPNLCCSIHGAGLFHDGPTRVGKEVRNPSTVFLVQRPFSPRSSLLSFDSFDDRSVNAGCCSAENEGATVVSDSRASHERAEAYNHDHVGSRVAVSTATPLERVADAEQVMRAKIQNLTMPLSAVPVAITATGNQPDGMQDELKRIIKHLETHKSGELCRCDCSTMPQAIDDPATQK